jgi:hypothetical protein
MCFDMVMNVSLSTVNGKAWLTSRRTEFQRSQICFRRPLLVILFLRSAAWGWTFGSRCCSIWHQIYVLTTFSDSTCQQIAGIWIPWFKHTRVLTTVRSLLGDVTKLFTTNNAPFLHLAALQTVWLTANTKWFKLYLLYITFLILTFLFYSPPSGILDEP